jgi:hypothetical protein
MPLRYIRPDESIMFAPVSGTVDDTYLPAWLTFGDPSHPARTTGNMSLTVSPSPAQSVDVIAVCHHNIREAASIALGGSVSSTIETHAHPPDDIPTNWYRLLTTPVSVSSLSLSVTGNTDPVIVGELYAGLSRTLPPLRLGKRLAPGEVFPWEGEYSLLAPYDPGVHRTTRLQGTFYLTESQLNELHDWHLSQRNGSRPTLIILDYPQHHALLAVFNYEAEDFAPGDALVEGSPVTDAPVALFLVTMQIVEIPRLRWP